VTVDGAASSPAGIVSVDPGAIVKRCQEPFRFILLRESSRLSCPSDVGTWTSAGVEAFGDRDGRLL
jgi:hypothetical protein